MAILEVLYVAARAAINNRSPDGLCARMIDERQVAGHRVYMTAERYLGVAWDNHSALITLIQSPHGLSPSAPWNLLRPTFEAAFHAAWVLDPEESLERRRRALRVEWLDELDHRRYYAEAMRMRSAIGDADWQEARRHLVQRRSSGTRSSCFTMLATGKQKRDVGLPRTPWSATRMGIGGFWRWSQHRLLDGLVPVTPSRV